MPYLGPGTVAGWCLARAVRRAVRLGIAAPMTLRRPAAILLAVALDLALGEPPGALAPRGLAGARARLGGARAPGRSVADGAAAVTLGDRRRVGRGAPARGRGARGSAWPGVVLEALALKPAFALRRLGEAADGVEAALRAGDLETARTRVGRDLVSRPTGDLAADEVASAAIESAAENLVDSIAAPILAYAVGGLPAAWAYRAVNTADAMWGYRDARYERFGKAAARLDDLANLVPARLGAAGARGGRGPGRRGRSRRRPGRVGAASAARRARTPAGRWRRWPAPSTSGSRSAGRTGSARARCPPRPTRSVVRVACSAPRRGITVVLLAGVALLGGRLPVSRGEPA